MTLTLAAHNGNIEVNVYPITKFSMVLNQWKKEMQNNFRISFFGGVVKGIKEPTKDCIY